MKNKETMNAKMINLLFLIIVLTHMFIVVMMYIFPDFRGVEGISSIVMGQLIIVVPTVLFFLIYKFPVKELFVFRKIKVTTVLLIVLYMMLMMPLTSLLNAISQIFSSNVVLELSTEITKFPFALTWLLVGFLGPVAEELVCRSIFYEAYKKQVSPVKAMIFSALIFGLLHMNLNQMPYAFALGILLVLLKEATGTILAPILFHVFFNTNSVILMYGISPELLEETSDIAATMPNQLLITVTFLALLALLSTIIGLCLLPYIARRENRVGIFEQLKVDGARNKERIASISLYIAIAICFFFMVWQSLMQ